MIGPKASTMNDGFERLAQLAETVVPYKFAPFTKVKDEQIQENFNAIINALERKVGKP